MPLPSGGQLSSAAIVGSDGGVWAQSDTFPEASEQEVRCAVACTVYWLYADCTAVVRQCRCETPGQAECFMCRGADARLTQELDACQRTLMPFVRERTTFQLNLSRELLLCAQCIALVHEIVSPSGSRVLCS